MGSGRTSALNNCADVRQVRRDGRCHEARAGLYKWLKTGRRSRHGFACEAEHDVDIRACHGRGVPLHVDEASVRGEHIAKLRPQLYQLLLEHGVLRHHRVLNIQEPRHCACLPDTIAELLKVRVEGAHQCERVLLCTRKRKKKTLMLKQVL